MRVTVCEFPDELDRKAAAWTRLRTYIARERPNVVVLPEMPACSWIFADETFDASLWAEALRQHDQLIADLPELAVDWVVSSRPVEQGGRRLNEAFVWSRESGYRAIRTKWYLPDAAVSRETTWFHQGDKNFRPVDVGSLKVGVQLCSETMYPEHARQIGLAGAHLIAQPRCATGHELWLVAARMSAVSSGCFVASANRRTFERDWFPGRSWLLSPDAEVIAETCSEKPFVTADLDPRVGDQARARYPRSLYQLYQKIG